MRSVFRARESSERRPVTVCSVRTGENAGYHSRKLHELHWKCSEHLWNFMRSVCSWDCGQHGSDAVRQH